MSVLLSRPRPNALLIDLGDRIKFGSSTRDYVLMSEAD